MKKTLFSLFLACCFIATQVTAKPSNPITVLGKPVKSEKKTGTTNAQVKGDCSGLQWNCHQADPVNFQHPPCNYVEHSEYQGSCCTDGFPCFTVIELTNVNPDPGNAVVNIEISSPFSTNFNIGSFMMWNSIYDPCPDGNCSGNWTTTSGSQYKDFFVCDSKKFGKTATTCPLFYHSKLAFTIGGCIGDYIKITVTMQDGTQCDHFLNLCETC